MLRTLTTASANTASSVLPHPNLTAALSLPFTRKSLTAIRATLAQVYPPVSADPKEVHAAVLIPVCNVNEQPSILLELRGKLRAHSGEVSFPGGRVDPTDRTFLASALRETREEIGVLPDQVEILGKVGPPQLSLNGLRVWPYVGFIHATPQLQPYNAGDDPGASLPSLRLDSLTLSQSEVAAAFHLPLAIAATPERLRVHHFRNGQPYWAVEVSDLVHGAQSELSHPSGKVSKERVEVWGLTGWYLSQFMKALKFYK